MPYNDRTTSYKVYESIDTGAKNFTNTALSLPTTEKKSSGINSTTSD